MLFGFFRYSLSSMVTKMKENFRTLTDKERIRCDYQELRQI